MSGVPWPASALGRCFESAESLASPMTPSASATDWHQHLIDPIARLTHAECHLQDSHHTLVPAAVNELTCPAAGESIVALAQDGCHRCDVVSNPATLRVGFRANTEATFSVTVCLQRFL